MSKRIIVVLLLSIFAFNVFADKRKEPLNIPVKVNYSLPKVALDVTICLERKVYKAGPFVQYAEKFLGVDPSRIISSDREEWKLLNVKLDSHSEVDSKNSYSLTISRDYSTMLFRLSPQGFLMGFNSKSEIENRNSDGFKLNALYPTQVKNVLYSEFSIDRPYVMVEDTTKKAKEGVVVTGANLFSFEFEGKTMEEKAKEAAHIIYKLRKRRFKILTSNFEVLPPDGSSYKVIVKELKKLEKKYLELFLGKEYVEKLSKDFKVIPTPESKSQVVVRYSPVKGFVGKSDVSGIPVIVEYRNIVKAESNISPVVQSVPAQMISYRLPAQVDVVLMAGKKELGTKSMVIPQLGSISQISLTVVAEEDLSIDFHPKYGSIKNIYKR